MNPLSYVALKKSELWPHLDKARGRQVDAVGGIAKACEYGKSPHWWNHGWEAECCWKAIRY